MKTLDWQMIKKTGALLMLAFVLASTAACAKKSGKAEVSNRYNRGTGGWQDGGGSYYDPNTGQYVSSAWGAFYNFSAYDLRNFMGFDQYNLDLGNVSNRPDDSTGVRFRGLARQGSQIYILVWDETASQTGQAFYWGMTVQSVQGGPQQGSATVVAADDYGSIQLQGSFSGGMWTGSVRYQNADGQSGSLGQFGIPQQAIFQ
jgi:hypothetical protein